MFEFCRLHCEYAELHTPLSSGLDELLITQILYLEYHRVWLRSKVPIAKLYRYSSEPVYGKLICDPILENRPLKF